MKPRIKRNNDIFVLFSFHYDSIRLILLTFSFSKTCKWKLLFSYEHRQNWSAWGMKTKIIFRSNMLTYYVYRKIHNTKDHGSSTQSWWTNNVAALFILFNFNIQFCSQWHSTTTIYVCGGGCLWEICFQLTWHDVAREIKIFIIILVIVYIRKKKSSSYQ